MKLLLINVVCGTGSTGRICTDIAKEYEAQGLEVKIAYGRQTYVPEQYRKYAIRIGTDMDVKLHAVYTRITDRHGFGSKNATKHFLKWAEEFDPDILWLHNIHGYYVNIELLFQWIKERPGMYVKWTLHDCWSFTGHCIHFATVNCMQWKTHCEHCIEKKRYPASYGKDNCFQNFERKKDAFTGVKNMQLIVPSKWLATLVKESFLKEYPIKVVYNTIDHKIFKPTASNFRERYGMQNKKIILGVSNTWNERKGFYDFLKLRTMLDESYVVVMVGLNDQQLKHLPKGITAIKKTNDPRELAQIYTAADLFVNPTYEDNYPTVNLEAQACGTPVITYNTGGCMETLSNEKSMAIDVGNIEELYASIVSLQEKRF